MPFSIGTITLSEGAGDACCSPARSMIVTNNDPDNTIWFKLGFDENVLATVHADTPVAPGASSDSIEVPGQTHISVVSEAGDPVLVKLCLLDFLERFRGGIERCY